MKASQTARSSFPLRKNRALLDLSYILFLITAFFVVEFPSFIRLDTSVLWNNWLYLLLVFALVVLGALVVSLSHVVFKRKPNVPVLVASGLLLFGNILTFAFLPKQIEVPFHWHETYDFSSMELAYYCLSSILTPLIFLVLFAYTPMHWQGSRCWRVILCVAIGATLAMVLYSLIAEWNIYQAIFSGSPISDWGAPTSWAGQKNAYGRFLLLGIFACSYLFVLERKIRYYLPMLFLFVALLFTMAKTAILIGIVVIIAMLIYGVIIGHKSRRLLVFHAIALGLAFILSFLILFLPANNLGFLGSIILSIRRNLDLGGGGTIDARMLMWQKCLDLWRLTPTSISLGYGDYVYPVLISKAMDFEATLGTSHNAFIEGLGRGGIIRVVYFALMLGYLLFLSIRSSIQRKRAAWLSLLLLLCNLFQGVFESSFLLNFSLESLVLAVLIMVPLQAQRQSDELSSPQSCTIHSIFKVVLLCTPLLIGLSLLIRLPYLAGLISLLIVALQIVLWRRLGSDLTLGLVGLSMNACEMILFALFPVANGFDYIALILFPILIAIIYGVITLNSKGTTDLRNRIS